MQQLPKYKATTGIQYLHQQQKLLYTTSCDTTEQVNPSMVRNTHTSLSSYISHWFSNTLHCRAQKCQTVKLQLSNSTNLLSQNHSLMMMWTAKRLAQSLISKNQNTSHLDLTTDTTRNFYERLLNMSMH